MKDFSDKIKDKKILLGIISVLEGNCRDVVEEIWAYLENEYGIKKVQEFEFPHMTFQGGKVKDLKKIKQNFNKELNNIRPFIIQTTGVANFGKRVIYIKVKKTKKLEQIHRRINNFLEKNCDEIVQNYTSENWIPHITLVLDDLKEECFRKVYSRLKKTNLNFKIHIHNIHLVYMESDGEIKILSKNRLR